MSDPTANATEVETESIDITSLTNSGFRLDAAAARQLMQAAGGNAGLIQALKAKLSSLVGQSSGFIESLPAPVRNRVAYLQTLQEQHDELQEQFAVERAALEAKYRKLYAPLYEKRTAVVAGTEEAPPSLEDEQQGEQEESAEPAVAEAEEVPAGIPDFWLNVLRNHQFLEPQITEKDEAVLEYLTDIRMVSLSDDDEEGAGTSEQEDEHDEPKGFKLIFSFRENPYFSNKELVKTYYMIDEQDPVLEKATGTRIDWAQGKNPTVKVVTRKSKGKGGKGAKPAQTKTEPVMSFFNFFSPPEVPADSQDLDENEMEELQTALEEDYEVGEIIKEQLLPNAVRWYTGEALAEDHDGDDDGSMSDDDEEGESGEDEVDNEDDEEDDDEEEKTDDASPAGQRAGGGQRRGAPKDSKEQPQECKQQ